MKLITSDEKKVVEIGSNDYLYCFYSTIYTNLSKQSNEFPLALEFLKTGMCAGRDGYETAKQFNLIRDELSKLKTDKIVYDMTNIELKAPWADNISPIVTSCGNFFTTSQGKDLIFEINTILCYAQIQNVDVLIQE